MTIGKLSVILGLNGSNFNSGLESSSDRLRKFSKDVQAPQTGIQRLIGGLGALKTAAIAVGAALAAGAIVRGIRNQISELDKLNDVAAKLGVVPEKLIGLQHAAELSGVGAEGMNDALQKMSIGIAKAAGGSGPAKDALEELGLSAKALSAMTPDQALLRVADAMEKVEGNGAKMALAQAIFGRGGIDMVRTLEGGSDAIRKNTEEAERFGMTLTSLDLKEIAAADDAFVRMKESITGVWTQLAVALAPAFKVLADGITWLATKVSWFVRQWGQGFRLLEMDAIRASSKIFEAFRTVFGDTEWRRDTQQWLDQSLADIEAEVAEMDNPIEGIGEEIGEAALEADKLKKALDFRPKLLEEGTQEFFDAIARFERPDLFKKVGDKKAPGLPKMGEEGTQGFFDAIAKANQMQVGPANIVRVEPKPIEPVSDSKWRTIRDLENIQIKPTISGLDNAGLLASMKTKYEDKLKEQMGWGQNEPMEPTSGPHVDWRNKPTVSGDDTQAMLTELKKITSETSRTTEATKRTASAIELLELPERMDF